MPSCLAVRIRSRSLRAALRLFTAIVFSTVAFLAHAQDSVVCTGDQIKIYGWGGVAWEAASPNCSGGILLYPTRDAWQQNVQSTCLASSGAANLQWGAIRQCNRTDILCGVGLNGYAMELFFDNPQAYRADDKTAAQVGISCRRGYYVAVSPSALPKTGNPCSACEKGKGQRAPSGDPADLTSGNEYQEATDYVTGDGKLSLRRAYNSKATQPTSLGNKWNLVYAARIVPLWGSSDVRVAISAIYAAPSQACTSGWVEVAEAMKKVSPETEGATAKFVTQSSTCVLSTGTTLPISYTASNSVAVIKATWKQSLLTDNAPTVAYMTVWREDGAAYQFTCQDSNCKPNSNISLRLELLTNGFVVKDDTGRVETYDTNGKLQSVVEIDGYRQDMVYGGDQLIAVTDSSGRQLAFGYTGSLVTPATLPDGVVVAYEYSADSELTKVTYPTTAPLAIATRQGCPTVSSYRLPMRQRTPT